ncbi:MAG: ABC transporter permease subunit [Granulosicoccus sp.]|nr:ABC transporter permease subunit [Granulosicoccus sp.]
MWRYALSRLATALPVLWIAVTVCFFILRLAPGGPFDSDRPLPPAIKANLDAHYNLDKSLPHQYFLYVKDLMRGDLGPSFTSEDFTVADQILSGLPYTIKYGLIAFFVAVAGGIIAGILGGLYRNHWPDYFVGAAVLLGLVIPNFLIAPVLQLVFGLKLDWLPVGGWGDGSLAYLALPVVVLAWPHIARISRLMRGSIIEVLNSPFIRTARSKGLSDRRIVFNHALRPALMPVVSYLGPAAGYLLTGSLVVESIFGLPGIGRFFITAALNRDYGMVLGTVIFYMVLILILNLIVDVIYAWLDPRMRNS